MVFLSKSISSNETFLMCYSGTWSSYLTFKIHSCKLSVLPLSYPAISHQETTPLSLIRRLPRYLSSGDYPAISHQETTAVFKMLNVVLNFERPILPPKRKISVNTYPKSIQIFLQSKSGSRPWASSPPKYVTYILSGFIPYTLVRRSHAQAHVSFCKEDNFYYTLEAGLSVNKLVFLFPQSNFLCKTPILYTMQ